MYNPSYGIILIGVLQATSMACNNDYFPTGGAVMAPKKPKDFQEEAQKLEDEFDAGVAFSSEVARRIMNAPTGCSIFIFQHDGGIGEYIPPAKEKKEKGQ